MPVDDPQFWLVSFAALWAVWHLVRSLMPRRSEDGSPSCGGCSTGAAACAKPATEAQLVTLGRNSPKS